MGYMVIPESLWDAINKIQDTLLICAPAVSQHAALAAIGRGARYARGASRPARRDAPAIVAALARSDRAM